jgi:hypothetical protein
MILRMSIERPLHANLLESLAIEFFNESFLRKHYDAVTINHSGYIVKHWLSFSLGYLRTIVKRKISMAVFQVGRFLPLSRGPSMF